MAQNDGVLAYPPPYAAPESSSGARISPTVLIIIVVVAFLFFISGVLHLLVKFLTKNRSSMRAFHDGNNEMSESDVLQRQLQQLFHLHDCGLDQAVIDALPIFLYKDIMGPKEPYDCAVCLCEFNESDKLRLLPMCSHAFHIGCIDTWLLSSSTCPVCRNSLFGTGFSVENPVFEFDQYGEEDRRYSCSGRKTVVLDLEEAVVADDGEKELPVRLGKFRKLDDQVANIEAGFGEASSSNFDGRRCYSMGSYQYIVGDSGLRVALSQDRYSGNGRFTRKNDHQANVDSTSSFEGTEGKKICNAGKGESLSVSKIWMWPKRGHYTGSKDPGIGFGSSLNTDAPWMMRLGEP